MENKAIIKKFPYLKNNKKVIYFDNGATTLKPWKVIKAEEIYNEKISANPHANDYDSALRSNEILNVARVKVQTFLNADFKEEIIFTSGATFSLNQVAFGLKDEINKGDEIFVTQLEHSSNLLPWVVIAKEKKAKIKEIPLKKDLTIDIKKMKEMISDKTKVIAFASVSNTIASINDVEKIVKEIRKIKKDVIISVDAAQSIAHEKTDVKKWDADFVSFSMHKMYGPFGIGVLYGKKDQLEKLKPLVYGGGMSKDVLLKEIDWKLEELPERLESGTPNISAINATIDAIQFVEEIGIENIKNHEKELKEYARKRIKEEKLEDKIDFYNLDNESPNLLFNVKGINPQDISTFLANDYAISTRSGSHCARRTGDLIETKVSVRASFAIYNTKKEIDKLITALKNTDNFLDYLFN